MVALMDLNLVRVFDALLAHRSVSAAAAELKLTQPAVSNALKRLRSATGDHLFVRTRNGMQPTAFALAAAKPLLEGLRLIRDGLERSGQFEPATTTRCFRLLMTDAGQMVFLPKLLPSLAVAAPHVSVKVTQVPVASYLEQLETDRADLALGALAPFAQTLVLRRLFSQNYVVLCHRRHPIASRGHRSGALAAFLDSHHVVVRPPNTTEAMLDVLARQYGWSLRIALDVPHFMVLPHVLTDTRLVALVPTLVGEAVTRQSDTVIVEAPFKTPGISIRMGWHQRQQKDAGHRWFRDLVLEQMRTPGAV